MKHRTNTLITLSAICLLLISFGLHSCADDEPSLDEQISALDLQTLPSVTYPTDNPPSAQKVELGRLLFWDPIISGEKNITCATCHHPSLGYGDAIDVSIGPGGTGLAPIEYRMAGLRQRSCLLEIQRLS
jgi:cytochrome c peroxidase